MKLIEGIVGRAPSIGALRREIHAHPELNFEEVRIAGEFEERELIAGGRLVRAPGALEAELFVERDGAVEVADADAGVKEFWHARRYGARAGASMVW